MSRIPLSFPDLTLLPALGALLAALAGAALAQETKAVPPEGKAAPAGVGQPGAPGNPWFPVVDQDLGVFFDNEQAVGKFQFRNPHGKTIEWKALTGSCTCTKAMVRVGDRQYELSSKPQPNTLRRITKQAGGGETSEVVTQIAMAPGESGEVEVHMDMHGTVGVKQASLDIVTTDPDSPMLKLRWHATGAQQFLVSPRDVQLNQMTWNETRDFTVVVTSPLQKDFNITRMDAAKDFDVKWSKELRDGVATWTITGKYGPVTNEVGGGGVLKFYSDLKNEASFTVHVMATVKGPLELKPGSHLSLGRIQKGTPKTERVVFESNDGVDLSAKELRLEKLSIGKEFVTVNQSKDGKNLVVELAISADAPTGLLSGAVVVELNHPAMPEKKITFNGYIR